MLALMLPLPMLPPGQGSANPLFWWPDHLLIVGAMLVGLAWFWRLAPCLTALFAWGLGRWWLNLVDLDPVGQRTLGYLLAAGILIWAVRRASRDAERVLAWSIVGVLVANLVIGLLQMAEWPWWLETSVPDHLVAGWVPAHPSWFLIRARTYRWPQGFMPHPNEWGLLMAIGLPIAWSLAHGQRGRPWWEGGTVIMLLGAVAASYSRDAVAAALAVSFAILWWRLRGDRLRALRGPAVAAALAGAAVLVSVLVVAHRWAPGWGGRAPIFAAAWPEILHWPWVGHGLGSWQRWAAMPGGPVQRIMHEDWGWWLDARSEPVQLLFELGLLGLVAGGLALLETMVVATLAADTGAAGVGWALAVGALGVGMWTGAPFHEPQLGLLAIVAYGRCQARARGG